MNEMEISNFISQCARKGLQSPEEIKEAALEEIKHIDKVLSEAESLRIRRTQMEGVIKSFGYQLPKSKRPPPILNEESSHDELDPETMQILLKVCSYLEEHDSASPRELMTFCNVNYQNDQLIYTVIKYLCVTGVCSRNEERALVKGTNWELRPKG